MMPSIRPTEPPNNRMHLTAAKRALGPLGYCPAAAGDAERWVVLAKGYAAWACQRHESLLFCGSGYMDIDALIEEGRMFLPAFD